jgi:hypothetical protein
MKNKDLIMLGIIIGIGFFFIGAIISNVFTSTDTNLIPYKASAFIKLIGLGILTSTMIIGGIIVDEVDKNLKILLLVLGLLLLIIYTLASPSLEWQLPSSESSDGYSSRPTGYGVPGFEAVFAFCAIIAIIIFKKMKNHLYK